jgi:hypothetical protein
VPANTVQKQINQIASVICQFNIICADRVLSQFEYFLLKPMLLSAHVYICCVFLNANFDALEVSRVKRYCFNELKVRIQEDIVAKLIDFLVAPHATTTVLLAEKEKVCLHKG